MNLVRSALLPKSRNAFDSSASDEPALSINSLKRMPYRLLVLKVFMAPSSKFRHRTACTVCSVSRISGIIVPKRRILVTAEANMPLTIYETAYFAQKKDEASFRRKEKSKRQQLKKLKRKFKDAPAYFLGMGREFYLTQEWRRVRWEVLSTSNGKCVMCGATKESSGRPMHVDHIKPRSRFPNLELAKDNLQVLCEACNMGKMTDTWSPR